MKMSQPKHTTLKLSIVVVVILINFTAHAHGDDDNVNMNLGINSTTNGNGYPVGTNTTMFNTHSWMDTVDLLKDNCLSDFIKTGNAIKNRFSQLVAVYKKDSENTIPDSSGRTFGLRKRIMSMALPLMFKFGVMFTVILTILALVVKTVIIGKMILILNVIGIVLKLVSLKKGHDGGGYHHSIPVAWVGGGGHGGWDTHSPQKEIHVHIHNNGGGHHTSYEPIPSGHASYGPYSGGTTGYGTISRSDGHTVLVRPTEQPKVIHKLVPYDPYPTNHYSSNEYVLV